MPDPYTSGLVRRSDRYTIWANRRNLKGTEYVLHEDLPDSYVKARGQLRPIMIAAQQKAMFIGDKLKVDDKIYEVGDINHLPPHLEPTNVCTQKTDMVLFFGKHSPLSNMHMCSITLDGQDNSSVEQYYQQQKGRRCQTIIQRHLM